MSVVQTPYRNKNTKSVGNKRFASNRSRIESGMRSVFVIFGNKKETLLSALGSLFQGLRALPTHFYLFTFGLTQSVMRAVAHRRTTAHGVRCGTGMSE